MPTRHLGNRYLWQDSVFGESAGTHEVVQDLALTGEAAGSIRHDPLTLSGPDETAQVGLGALTKLTSSKQK